jgi:nicotinamide-nucleotide amidase
MPYAEILSQGDEVVTGQIADTNAAWLSDRLTELGFTVRRHTAVGDRPEDIRDALVEISSRSDLCIGTGGLGPTDDDHTARAVAAAFDRPLQFDDEAMRQIEAMYAKFRRSMPEINRRQAWLPSGADRLDNAWGTAPGFAVRHHRCMFVFLPGVPREMKPMFEERVVPRLHEQFSLESAHLVTLRTVGIGESEMQARVGSIAHPGVTVGTRTILPENHLKLRFIPSIHESERRAIATEIAARIGTAVFAIEGLGEPGGSLAEVVGRMLVQRGATLATAESCTGGRLAAACTSISGSSAWFVEGTVCYANAAKLRLLGVDPAALEQHGAVSEPVARQMAQGARAAAQSTYALSTTGIAGPGGGSDAKPIGTVHLALATPAGAVHREIHLGGDRSRIQDLATASALDLLRRHLAGEA